ncbi:sensor histidine kinase [Curtobacterium sp. RRHDQ10]|uniref:sensor histidine kinase n=1 Tax=Curtobacterium phyllosphaerae TaxID=3413379 RepID=UPI003BEFC62D
MALAEVGARRRRTDVLVAVGTAVLSLGLVLGLPPLDTADLDGPGTGGSTVYPAVATLPWVLCVLALLAQSAVLTVASRTPRTTLVVVAAIAAIAAVAPSSLYGLVVLPVVVAVVLLGLRLPLARLWPALVSAGVLVAVGTAVDDAAASGSFRAGWGQGIAGSGGHGVLQALSAVALPLLVVLVIRSRRDVRAARTAEASAVDREHDARLEAAISRERSAMARELHDIAAHHLSGIALMSAVIDRQIDSDPERAHEGARQVREQSTAVLEDLRRLVGLLREDGPAERAVETVPGIVDLVEQSRYRSAVELVVEVGPERPLADGIGPLAQLAAYRTVQESLANAALHAPGATSTVTIDDRGADQLVVRIDTGRPTMAPPAPTGAASGSGSGSRSGSASGNGLRGMRERAELVGASLEAGPRDGGGWSVVLVLDREARLDAATSGPGVQTAAAPAAAPATAPAAPAPAAAPAAPTDREDRP